MPAPVRRSGTAGRGIRTRCHPPRPCRARAGPSVHQGRPRHPGPPAARRTIRAPLCCVRISIPTTSRSAARYRVRVSMTYRNPSVCVMNHTHVPEVPRQRRHCVQVMPRAASRKQAAPGRQSPRGGSGEPVGGASASRTRRTSTLPGRTRPGPALYIEVNIYANPKRLGPAWGAEWCPAWNRPWNASAPPMRLRGASAGGAPAGCGRPRGTPGSA